MFVHNANAEYDGCYAPQEMDPFKIAELTTNSQSFSEDDDGTGALNVLAVGYDTVSV